MGLMRKAIRKSMPKPVREATRTVHQVAHPVSTARKAATPQPIKSATRAAFSVTHPFEVVESMAENVVVDSLTGRTRRTRKPAASGRAGQAAQSRVVSHGGFVDMPSRITDAWLREAVPTFSQAGLATFVSELKRRGWTDAELRARVYPLV